MTTGENFHERYGNIHDLSLWLATWRVCSRRQVWRWLSKFHRRVCHLVKKLDHNDRLQETTNSYPPRTTRDNNAITSISCNEIYVPTFTSLHGISNTQLKSKRNPIPIAITVKHTFTLRVMWEVRTCAMSHPARKIAYIASTATNCQSSSSQKWKCISTSYLQATYVPRNVLHLALMVLQRMTNLDSFSSQRNGTNAKYGKLDEETEEN